MSNIWLKMAEADLGIIKSVINADKIDIKSVNASLYSMLYQILLKCFKAIYVKDNVEFFTDDRSLYSVFVLFRSRYPNLLSQDSMRYMIDNLESMNYWICMIYFQEEEGLNVAIDDFEDNYIKVKQIYNECKEYIEKD